MLSQTHSSMHLKFIVNPSMYSELYFVVGDSQVIFVQQTKLICPNTQVITHKSNTNESCPNCLHAPFFQIDSAENDIVHNFALSYVGQACLNLSQVTK